MSDWFSLHGEGWTNEIVPDAFSHPAKFARGLIRRIYEHAIEEGWLVEGDTVVDPFAGVALGGLDAMFHGLHFIGVELEDKFVDLGRQNIDLWNSRYGNGMLPRWGTAVIVQGDSRNLAAVLDGARAKGIITSPPFQQQVSIQDMDFYRKKCLQTGRNPDSAHAQGINRYSTNPANLGNMREGDHVKACIISSPPYTNRRPEASGSGVDLRKQYETYRAQGGGASFEKFCRTQRLHSQDYGQSEGQLAAMPEGDVKACIISSPPWEKSIGDAANTSEIKIVRPCLPDAKEVAAYLKQKRLEKGLSAKEIDDYLGTVTLYSWYEGRPAGIQIPTPDNWLKLKELLDLDDRFDDGILTIQKTKATSIDTVGKTGHLQMTDYGQTSGQLGQEQGDTFWSAAKEIVSQCHQVLAPGGHAIFVTKRFVRDKKIVEFSQQWAELCESVGFELVHWHKAWLIEDKGTQYTLDGKKEKKEIKRASFFRRLYESKYPENSIDWEDVLCFVKSE